MLDKVFSMSLVGKINKTLGGVLGLVRGIAIAVVFAFLINLLISLTGGFLCFTQEAVDSSNIFKLILEVLSDKI